MSDSPDGIQPGALTLDDPRLWTVTNHCLSIYDRSELLGVARDTAKRNRSRCLQRVAAASAQTP